MPFAMTFSPGAAMRSIPPETRHLNPSYPYGGESLFLPYPSTYLPSAETSVVQVSVRPAGIGMPTILSAAVQRNACTPDAVQPVPTTTEPSAETAVASLHAPPGRYPNPSKLAAAQTLAPIDTTPASTYTATDAARPPLVATVTFRKDSEPACSFIFLPLCRYLELWSTCFASDKRPAEAQSSASCPSLLKTHSTISTRHCQ